MIDKIIKWFHKTFFKPYKYATYSSVRIHPMGNKIMTVYWSDGTMQQFTGSCTVWREYPEMKRCDTEIESWVRDLEQYHIHKNNT